MKDALITWLIIIGLAVVALLVAIGLWGLIIIVGAMRAQYQRSAGVEQSINQLDEE